MSDPRNRRGPGGQDDDFEEAGGSLEPNPELEAAMRAAAEAVEARHSARHEDAREDGSGEEAGTGRGEAAPAAEPAELAALKDRYLRLAADFENFRRRALKDREEAHQFGHQNLVKDLLPSVDNLERAIDHARKGGEGGQGALLEGVELVLRELESVLAKHGVISVEALGQPFDPGLHEAVAQTTDSTRPPNTVTEVFQRGYQLRNRLLRPARVVVSKPPETGRDGEGG
jgi:molecular chaperone GrpE